MQDSLQNHDAAAVKVIESPREAWHSLSKVPAEVKADYLRVLIAAGFCHIDAVSFAPAEAELYASQSESLLADLDPPDDVEIIGLVLDERGAERAVETNAISKLAFPYSISPAFLDRNQRRSPEDALDALEAIGTLAYKAGMDVMAHMAMAFGNPDGDPWDIDEVVTACDLLVDNGITEITLSDTVGLTTPGQIAHVIGTVLGIHSGVEIGLHLRCRREDVAAKVHAAYEAGCRRFHSTLGGHGGSSYGSDLLLVNLPTEVLVAELNRIGADMSPLRPLQTLIAASNGIAAKFGGTALTM